MQGLNLCRSTFLLRFWKYFLGFQIFWKKLFETLRIYMDSSLLMLFKKERWSCMFTFDLIGDFERDLLEIFDLILFVDFWLETENKSVFLAGLIPSSSSPVHILHLLFSSSSSKKALWSCLSLSLLGDEFALELQRKTIQWWRFTMNQREFDEFVYEFWCWRIRVLACSLWFLNFDLTEWREKSGVLFVMWRELNGSLWISLTLCTIYKLPLVLEIQWNGDTWTCMARPWTCCDLGTFLQKM